MKTYPYLFWGYNVIWLGIGGYLLYLSLRLGRLARSLERLERAERGPGDQESRGS